MTDTRDHPPGNRSLASPHSPASETAGSHLAHWPPPQRGREVKPVLATHHANEHHANEHHTNETDQHEKPHGLSLTRSVFKEDEDD